MTNDELDAWRWAEALAWSTARSQFGDEVLNAITEYRRLVREGIEPPAAVDQDTSTERDNCAELYGDGS